MLASCRQLKVEDHVGRDNTGQTLRTWTDDSQRCLHGPAGNARSSLAYPPGVDPGITG